MNNDYKPGLGELVKEMTLGFGKFVHAFSVGTVLGFTAPCYIPTATRILREARRRKKPDESPDKVGHTGAGIGSLVGFFSYIFIGFYLCERDSYEPLIIPAVMNVLSGVYELHRFAKKRLIEKNSEDNLENLSEQ